MSITSRKLNHPDLRGHTVLIIDDEPINLGVMSDYLGSFGLEVLVARGGQSGLEKARYARPDLVLLDVLMPGMDGFETCRRLKADEALRDIPVLFMTALAETEHKIKGFGVGAVDYITKPFQDEEVLARVTAHLRIRDLTRELQGAKETLERRVEERTAELAQANEKLQVEIAERRQAEKEVRRRATQQEALNTIISAAAAALDLPDLLRIALDHTLQALRLEMGAIWIADQLALRGLAPEFGPANAQAARAADLDIPGPIAVKDWEREADLHALGKAIGKSVTTLGPLMARFGIRASITVPVAVEGKRIGGLSVVVSEPRSWSPEEVALVEAVGRQLGTTAERLQLLERVQRHADRLARALEQQQELDRLRSEFVRNVSHELRTPLALIRGYTELLETGILGELQSEQQASVVVIARRARAMAKMMDDFAAIVDVETKLQRRPVDLAALVHEMLTDLQVQTTVEQATLTLTVEIAPDLSPMSGDAIQLERVVDNLLDNALKFTPAGGHIAVRLWQEGENLVLEVSDTGIGIPDDQLERVFERFYQIDGSTTRRYGGTGLGLALVKEIVEAHEGHVTVQSTMGKGSTFTVTLPIGPTDISYCT
jgi:signal transduction histidine kinase